MPKYFIRTLCAGILFAVAPAAASAAGPIKVHVRVEGVHRTLVSERTVTLADAPIVKDGDASHSCPGQTGAGALQQGTGGAWSGKWDDGFGDYLVDTIRGEKHPAQKNGPDYWAFWVDDKVADTGVCQTKLKPGDDVLFFADSCVFDAATNQCKNPPALPLAAEAPASARLGKPFTIAVVDYTAAGKEHPVAGATVTVNGRALPKRTDRHGHVEVRGSKVGRVAIQAKKAGLVRSAVVHTRIRKG